MLKLDMYKKIWLFGKSFDSIESIDFKESFRLIPLFTYRVGFEKIYPSDLDSDVGWGCMIRTGQMMIGRCLINIKTNSDNEIL